MTRGCSPRSAVRSSNASSAHVFVDDLAAPALDQGDRHHLGRALRLRPGEPVTASDGAGRWRPCVWSGDGLEAVGAAAGPEPAPRPTVTVAFALTKGERPEWVVQKLTEAGVDRIVPFVAARSVVRWEPDKAARNAERLRAVARAAAMQCRRVWLPSVEEVVPFSAAAALPGAALAAAGGERPGLGRPTGLVGPEGGGSDEERACGRPSVSLGPAIYRAETAAVAAGVLLTALREGLVT